MDKEGEAVANPCPLQRGEGSQGPCWALVSESNGVSTLP